MRRKAARFVAHGTCAASLFICGDSRAPEVPPDVGELESLPHPKAPLCKGGRLRALPVADTASNKEWQRSKFRER